MSLIYSPGPAAYDLGSGIGKAPAVSLKGRYKESDALRSPGPGAYKLADSIGGPGNSPSYTMRPKTSDVAEAHLVPGPGAYNPDPSRGKGPKISMAPKLNLAGLTDGVPGSWTPRSHRHRSSGGSSLQCTVAVTQRDSADSCAHRHTVLTAIRSRGLRPHLIPARFA